MEIKGGYKDILSVVTTEDVVEGRFGLLKAHTQSYDFGSRSDLPGWGLPTTEEETRLARYMIAWAVDNRATPIFSVVPSTVFNSRGGFGQAANVPFSATVYLTQPGHQEGLTIPSGVPSLAFNGGSYKVASGEYIDNENLKVVGAMFIVSFSGEDKGKPEYSATMTDRVIGTVIQYNSSDDSLFVRLFD